MNAEAKVGAFTIGGLMMLCATTFSLGNFNFGSDENYTLYAGFKQVIGLEPQAAVMLSGVPIGKVTEIKNDGGGVTVTSSGVMGEKFVNIVPQKSGGVPLKNGDYLYGSDEAGMDSMFEGMNKVLEKVDMLVASMNQIIGDPKFQQSVVDMSENMKNASDHMNGLMNTLDRMAAVNEGNINQMAQQLNSALGSLEATMQTVEHMATSMDNLVSDPQAAEDLKSTLANISAASGNIAHMAENMDSVMGDRETADNMKATIRNAKNLTERADAMLGKVSGAVDEASSIEVTPSVDLKYSGSADDWNTDFNVDVSKDDVSLVLGVEDIGDGDHVNAQVGKHFKDLSARAGIIAGKPGVGLDYNIGSRLRVTAEAYDPNDETVRLKSQYKIADSTYLLGEWHDVNDSDKRAAYFGLKREGLVGAIDVDNDREYIFGNDIDIDALAALKEKMSDDKE